MKEPRKTPPRKSRAEAEEKLDEELAESFRQRSAREHADLCRWAGADEASRAREVDAPPLKLRRRRSRWLVAMPLPG